MQQGISILEGLIAGALLGAIGIGLVSAGVLVLLLFVFRKHGRK